MHESDLAPLARLLEAVASPVRLEILKALRAPRAISEVRVTAERSREGENPERPISRQAVTHHVEQLEAIGLVERVATPEGERFVLAHPRLFALTDELRRLAKLRAFVDEPAPQGATMTTTPDAAKRADLPPPPRLLVAYGRDDGVAFALHGAAGSSWRVGRGAACEVRLDYDPFASTVSAVIERGADGYHVVDAGSRNGTWIDWERLPPNGRAKLADGRLLRVGRSLLVFQEH